MNPSSHLEPHPGTNPPSFQCTVVDSKVENEVTWISLDRSLFYPTGGGQPCDIGALEYGGRTIAVEEVVKRSRQWHKIGSESIESDTEVTAYIDTERRNKLSTMHTAQHLVSALADELFSGSTVGNQIGEVKTRIDLSFPDRSSFDKELLQQEVNRTISEGLPVKMHFAPRMEVVEDPLVRVNLDLLPKHIDELRVISIQGVDVCPCAGTHVENTSEIQPIEITRVKSKGSGKLRLEYELTE